MAMRALVRRITVTRLMEGTQRTPRYFSEDKGKLFREEERAHEKVYIEKMERERMAKLRQKLLEKEKAAGEIRKSETVYRKADDTHAA